MITKAIATRPATLAASSVDVRLCHATGGSSGVSSRYRLLTATDSSHDRRAVAGSADPGDHSLGEELHVLQIRHVENLQVDPLHTGFEEGAQLVDDLVGGAHHRRIGP